MLINSKAQHDEQTAFSTAIDALPYANDPIFVLGHWRSGTTYLHYLLCQDPQFSFVTREDCFRPYRLRRPEMPAGPRFFHKRQVDNLPIEPWMPGEDEFAIATRSLCSPFIGFAFPRDADYYDRYLSLDNVSGDELSAWRAAIMWVIKKTALWNPGRRVILKSPPHTARIRLLRDLFPRSQFIHLTRDPHESFRSLLQLVHTLGPGNALQEASHDSVVKTCLRRYGVLAHAVARGKRLIADNDFIECTYEQLRESPLQVLSNIYAKLRIGGFTQAECHFREYLNSQPSFVHREHPSLPDAISAELDRIALEVER